MTNIPKLKFRNKKNKQLGFEIVTLKEFFKEEDIDFITKPYRTEFYNMIYVTKGECTHEIDFIEYTANKGEILIIPNKRIHRYSRFDNDIEGYLVMFTEEFLCKFLSDDIYEIKELFNDTYLNPCLALSSEHNLVLEKLLDTMVDIYTQDELFKCSIIAAHFKTITLILKNMVAGDKIGNNNNLFVEFSRLLKENLSYIKTVEEYSKMLYISKKTLNLATRKAAGISAKEYIIQQIILRMKISLCFEDKSINEISNELGFIDASNMTKFFKRYTGLTPKQFRSENKSILK